MLGDRDATANIAVRDLETARRFYEDTLGLRPIGDEGEEVIVFQSGKSTMNVYRSEYAGTNKATAVTWAVDDVEDTVRELKSKGIRFEHYDLPELTRQGDFYVSGEFRTAWFKDPDGNILSIVEE